MHFLAFALLLSLAAPLSAAPPVVAWGAGTTTAGLPVNFGQSIVPVGLRSVTAVSAGGLFTVALKSDGTVTAWGYNADGETSVPPGLSGVRALSAGTGHTLALLNDGTVVAWGDNSFGATSVPAGLTGVIAVAAGGGHSLALKSDGTVLAWGTNNLGQTSVPPGLSGVIAIAAGGFHSVALKSDGSVVAWGAGMTIVAGSYSERGQSIVPPGLGVVTAIAAGGYHTVALRSDGSVRAWGENAHGQVTIPAGLGMVTAIAAGFEHTLALRIDGAVAAWGYNLYSQTTVPADLTAVTAIAAGHDHSVALFVPRTNADLAGLDLSSGTLAPSFLAGTTAYSASVPNATSSLTVTPRVADVFIPAGGTTATPRATVTVNGAAVVSGSASSPISLSVGNNLITIIVTAEDGITTKTYTVNVTRPPSSNANLSNLTVSSGSISPAFTSATTVYSSSVLYSHNTPVSVTPTRADPTSTVTVNGVPVSAGANFTSGALAVGLNVFTILVTAQDGISTKTYTLTVTRANPPSATLDIDFNPGGQFPGGVVGPIPALSETAQGVAFQSDGKILVAGYADYGNIYRHAFKLMRFNANGTLDTAGFGGGTGMVLTTPGNDDYGHAIAVQSDGKIVVAGQTSGGWFTVMRYTRDGVLDSTFNSAGTAPPTFNGGVTVPGVVLTELSKAADGANAVAIQSDGKIVVAGFSGVQSTSNTKFAVVRYNSNGTLDTTFNPGGSQPGTFSASLSASIQFDEAKGVAIQRDGKIVVGGTAYSGSSHDYAALRLNPDGSLDLSFNGTGKVTTDLGGQEYGYGIALQNDGKILLAGSNGSGDHFQVLRYTTSGGLDPTFASGGVATSSFRGVARSIAVQRDQKILLGGYSSIGSSYGNFTMMRYRADGTLDPTFNSSGTPGYLISPHFTTTQREFGFSIASHGDGKIVMAGNTANWGSPETIALARYNAGPEMVVEQPSGNNLTDGVSQVDFGTPSVGGTSDRTFTIKSVGTADLTGSGLTLSGTDASSFTITASAMVPAPPGGSTTFTIQFHPSTAGAKTAVVHIAGNTLDDDPFDITLTGATDALVQPSPAPAPVNNLQTGLPQQMVSVNNSGTRTLGGVRLGVTGVPAGVTVAGGTYVPGTDTWLVDYNFLLAAGQSGTATLNYSGSLGAVVPTIVIVPPPDVPTLPDPGFATATKPPVLDATTGNAALLLRSQPGRTYRVEYSADGMKTWLPLTGAVLSRSGQILFSDDGTTTGTKPRNAPNRYYRVTDIAP